MEMLTTRIRAMFSTLVLLLAVWWLWEVQRRLGTEPRLDDKGSVVVDEFQRAKDILLVVLPLVTTILGYWFGAQGKEKAEEKAKEATAKLEAVVDASGAGVLEKAKTMHPNAFR